MKLTNGQGPSRAASALPLEYSKLPNNQHSSQSYTFMYLLLPSISPHGICLYFNCSNMIVQVFSIPGVVQMCPEEHCSTVVKTLAVDSISEQDVQFSPSPPTYIKPSYLCTYHVYKQKGALIYKPIHCYTMCTLRTQHR